MRNYRKRRNTKIIIIMILLVLVTGLSIGFAVFSDNLTISSSALVSADPSNFKVLFSSKENTLTTGSVATSSVTGKDTKADNATINNNGSSPSISGLKAMFKVPNSTINYTFYVTNQGSYTAYLNEINFANISGQNVKKKCTAKAGTSQASVDEACKYIAISINFGTDNSSSNPLYAVSTTKSNINNQPLNKGAYMKVRVWIAYGYNNANAPVADGDFDVEFGDIILTYSSAD